MCYVRLLLVHAMIYYGLLFLALKHCVPVYVYAVFFDDMCLSWFDSITT